MIPFRCVNPACTTAEFGLSKFDFWGNVPKCPKCGADERDPESRHLIVRLVIVHFGTINKWGKGTGKYACAARPNGADFSTPLAVGVNCPACQATETWQQAAAASNFQPIVEITPELAESLRQTARTVLVTKGAMDRPETARVS